MAVTSDGHSKYSRKLLSAPTPDLKKKPHYLCSQAQDLQQIDTEFPCVIKPHLNVVFLL